MGALRTAVTRLKMTSWRVVAVLAAAGGFAAIGHYVSAIR